MAFVVSLAGHRGRSGRVCMSADQNGKDAPILLRAARGELVERPPVWLMRQAGRYMKAFREYSEKYSFRHRSETPEIGTKTRKIVALQRFLLTFFLFSDAPRPTGIFTNQGGWIPFLSC
mmetsp:Transcript_16775/g.68609  ORF Transcript_16775/g.68609 Transcript_16775/m.68609 type:complete len:119 (+) Transcript_16775:216-572(+)